MLLKAFTGTAGSNGNYTGSVKRNTDADSGNKTRVETIYE
jgi:hypothetical protein